MKFEENPQYSRAKPYLKMVRDSMEGEPAIKRGREIYLKHPNMVDPESAGQTARYEAYIDGAEFDGFPGETESTMLGQMLEGEIVAELPSGIEYLEQNSDGDGMPLSGAVEVIYRNLLQAKYYLLLAEYQGLADVDTESLSIADLQELNPRASIKHYTRESLIDWDFARIGGVMQLTYALLVEEAHIRDSQMARKQVRSYLALALDEDGNYYQQKYIEGDGVVDTDGERVYPIVNGSPLTWIPMEIVVDEETPAGKLPEGMGYLYPICSAALSRYRVSADYKEALRLMQPTLFTSGWKEGDWDHFTRLNERDYLAFGAGVANNLPEGVTVDIKGLGVETEPFLRYFEQNENKARALGAKIENGQGEGVMSATQAALNASRNSAAMRKVVRNTEAALRRVVSYCAMFEGLWSPDEVETNLDQITINLPTDFGVRMTAEDVNSTLLAINAGVLSQAEGVRKLVAGGFAISDADTILGELETRPQIV